MLSFLDRGIDSNHGYYMVGNQIYVSKYDAMLHASKNNSNKVYWNFHDNKLSNVNFKIKPTKPLTQLYKERAQQIRDKYDYLILTFSGGADSHNILRTFLDNNIRLDEIVTRATLKYGRKYYQANNKDTHTRNIMSEYEYAAYPIMQEVAKSHPNIKLSVVDRSDDYLNEVTVDEFKLAGHRAVNGLISRRVTGLYSLEELHGHKKPVGVIHGADKMHVYKDNNKWFFNFSDMMFLPIDAYETRRMEYFYWSPDSPELLSGLAHAVYDYYKTRPELHDLLELTPYGLPKRILEDKISIYDGIYKSIVYPHWNPNTFQAGKMSSFIYEQDDDNFILSNWKDYSSTQSWKHIVDSFISPLHKSFLIEKQVDGITKKMLGVFRSKNYIITE